MLDLIVPDLTFPEVKYGDRGIPWDLRVLLYRGGARSKVTHVASMINEGKLGAPKAERLDLVAKFHERIQGDLAGGGSKATAEGQLYQLRQLYHHADCTQVDLTETNLKAVYLSWVAALLQEQRLKKIKALTAYRAAATAGRLVADVLGVPTATLRRSARIRKPRESRRVLSSRGDKQNLTETMAFGHALLDIAMSLSLVAIRGQLPVSIRFRTGQVIDEWAGLRIHAANTPSATTHPERERGRETRLTSFSLRTRFPLVNLRVEAELLIFIAQTGMNLAQAAALKMGEFSYQSHHGGYLVRRQYKARRKGEVEFEIFSEYRLAFEDYLSWRNALIPNDPEGFLFPAVEPSGTCRRHACEFKRIRMKCAQIGIAHVCPLVLRRTRINWLLRQSKDPDLTAEMAQHNRETLLRDYEKPSHQVAMVEATRYFQQSDLSIAPPGPGACTKPEALPLPLPSISKDAPQPDCISPAGCLFCMHQRDIDSFDHVWSLSSYRYLKSLEQARYVRVPKSAAERPALLVVERITEKLAAFASSSRTRSEWTCEAQARVDEGEYHTRWAGFIQLAEMGA